MTVVVRAIAVLAVFLAPASGDAMAGFARVVDGDILQISGQRVRLFGLDAPEMTQTCRTEQNVSWACGAWISARLKARLRNHRVTCEGHEKDRYGRLIARCSVDGADIGGWLVGNGFAFAYRRYSRAYVPAETRARARELGLWSGTAQEPALYRHQRRRGSPSPDPGCRIKGNVSSRGKLFHLPGSRWYDRTRISLAKGERWFCSQQEARRAGWGPARE